MTSPPASSTPSCSVLSSSHTRGLSTITIKYTCRRCSGEHILSFQSYLSMNIRTCPRSITRSLQNLLEGALLEWVIRGKTSTASAEQKLGVLKKQRKRTS